MARLDCIMQVDGDPGLSESVSGERSPEGVWLKPESEHDVGDASGSETLGKSDDHRGIANRKHRLRHVVRQRTKPRSKPSDQHHCEHELFAVLLGDSGVG